MQTVRELASLRETIAAWRAAGERVALVPTMGALHAGHLALVAIAQGAGPTASSRRSSSTPSSSAPNEDLDAISAPRSAPTRALLADAGCDLLWLPPVEVMYPDGFATNVAVAGVSEPLDGAARPGHFDGVATVVAKLFNQVRPDVAVFGEKDFQQLAVIRRMVADLDFGIEIVGVPTQRDDDGLALSSRNVYLDARRARRARSRCRARWAWRREAIAARRRCRRRRWPRRAAALDAAGFAVDYVELADAETLGAPVAGRPRRLLAAARIGGDAADRQYRGR